MLNVLTRGGGGIAVGCALMIALSGLWCAPTASGDILSSDPNANPVWYEYDSRDANANPGGPFSVNDTGSFSLPQFDTQGGTRALQAVTLIVEGWAFGGRIYVENEDGSSGGNATATVGAGITVDNALSTAPLVVLVIPKDSNSHFVDPDDPAEGFFPDFAGTDCLTVGLNDGQDLDSATIDQNLDEYVGDGEITWTFDSDTIATYNTTFAPFTVSANPTQFDFRARVQYIYEGGIPEPVSIALLGGGAFVLLRRRRRRPAL